MKEEALKQAEELLTLISDGWSPANAIILRSEAMIRKLVAELDKEKAKSVNSANSDFNNCFTKTASESLSQTKPLSDEEIVKVWNSFERDDSNLPFVNFARAIEERHGIK